MWGIASGHWPVDSANLKEIIRMGIFFNRLNAVGKKLFLFSDPLLWQPVQVSILPRRWAEAFAKKVSFNLWQFFYVQFSKRWSAFALFAPLALREYTYQRVYTEHVPAEHYRLIFVHTWTYIYNIWSRFLLTCLLINECQMVLVESLGMHRCWSPLSIFFRSWILVKQLR